MRSRSTHDYSTGGCRPARIPQLDTYQASKESHNSIHNQPNWTGQRPRKIWSRPLQFRRVKSVRLEHSTDVVWTESAKVGDSLQFCSRCRHDTQKGKYLYGTVDGGGRHQRLHFYCFYRAMHYSAKRGLAIACRLPVCLSVCLSVRLWR